MRDQFCIGGIFVFEDQVPGKRDLVRMYARYYDASGTGHHDPAVPSVVRPGSGAGTAAADPSVLLWAGVLYLSDDAVYGRHSERSG